MKIFSIVKCDVFDVKCSGISGSLLFSGNQLHTMSFKINYLDQDQQGATSRPTYDLDRETSLQCLICDRQFVLKKELDDFLGHLFLDHRMVGLEVLISHSLVLNSMPFNCRLSPMYRTYRLLKSTWPTGARSLVVSGMNGRALPNRRPNTSPPPQMPLSRTIAPPCC